MLTRSNVDPVKRTVVAASVPAALVLFTVVFDAVHREPPAPASAPAATPAAAAPLQGEPVHPAKRRLRASDLARLTASRGAAVAGYIDALDGISADGDPAKLRFARGRPITIKGWAGDPSTGPGAALIAVVDEKQRIDITRFYDKSRLDVARHYGRRAMEFSGFEDALVSTAHLAKGRHRISLGIVPPAGLHYLPAPQVRWFELF